MTGPRAEHPKYDKKLGCAALVNPKLYRGEQTRDPLAGALFNLGVKSPQLSSYAHNPR